MWKSHPRGIRYFMYVKTTLRDWNPPLESQKSPMKSLKGLALGFTFGMYMGSGHFWSVLRITTSMVKIMKAPAHTARRGLLIFPVGDDPIFDLSAIHSASNLKKKTRFLEKGDFLGKFNLLTFLFKMTEISPFKRDQQRKKAQAKPLTHDRERWKTSGKSWPIVRWMQQWWEWWNPTYCCDTSARPTKQHAVRKDSLPTSHKCSWLWENTNSTWKQSNVKNYVHQCSRVDSRLEKGWFQWTDWEDSAQVFWVAEINTHSKQRRDDTLCVTLKSWMEVLLFQWRKWKGCC